MLYILQVEISLFIEWGWSPSTGNTSLPTGSVKGKAFQPTTNSTGRWRPGFSTSFGGIWEGRTKQEATTGMFSTFLVLQSSHHFFIQSEVNRSHTFSRALRQLHVITSNFDWFTVCWEPIKAVSRQVQPTQRAGKRVWTTHDWIWFYTWLDGNVPRVFSKPIAWHINAKPKLWHSSKIFYILALVSRSWDSRRRNNY